MTILKFIFPVLILSCNNSKTKNNVLKADTIKQVSDVSIQAKIDSNYLENLNYIKENPYSDRYDTIIKGSFSISYVHDKKLQYLLYKKKQKIIDTIGGCSLGLPYNNLGYIGADFDKTFVFVNSFGSGNPNYI